MSFSKLAYDSCAYEKYLEECVGIGEYMLNTPGVSCEEGKSCFYPSPHVRLDKTGVAVCESKPLIDVDSELLGLNMKQVKCPKERTFDSSYCDNAELKDCGTEFLTAEETKMSNPACNLRGTGWNRFDFLHENPQDRAMMPFDREIQNRLVVKDNHRPCIPSPQKDMSLPNDDGNCYTDVDAPTASYSGNNPYPFIHWRSCDEIRKL